MTALAVPWLLAGALAAPAPVKLELTAAQAHDLTLAAVPEGGWEIQTTGGDPYVFTTAAPAPFDPATHPVLAFEFFSTTGTDALQVFCLPPLAESHSVKGPGLIRSEGWSSHAVDLAEILDLAPRQATALRLDFGNQPGRTIRLRNLVLRERTAQERDLLARQAAREASQQRLDTFLRDYLQRPYPAQVTRVTVAAEAVTITGQAPPAEPGAELAELPLYAALNDPAARVWSEPLPARPDGRFEVTVPREVDQRDRLLSRWAVIRRAGAGFELLSHARYPDQVACANDLPLERPRHKKGLGGFHLGPWVSDLDALDIAAATVNVVLNSLVHTTAGTGRTPFEYAGRTWYADDGALDRLDQTLRECARRRIVVSAILLVGQPRNAAPGSFTRLLAHPDADPAGIYAMPDVSSAAGLAAYGAVLDLLARRYSRPDAQHGRIHHYILHNEVNAGWVWTNAGRQTDVLYVDLYHKSLRTAQLIARQYHPHLQPFVSLEHHWTMRMDPRCHSGVEILDRLCEFDAAEGSFDWAVAHHPYPQNLRDPRVWADTQVNSTPQTPKVTFKNLEVLDAWARLPAHQYAGRPRTIHLTEQGLNSPDYSPASLRDQAAGMAYAWHKVRDLPTIEVFHYHNWIDNRHEGGLRIGLRRFPDDPEDPGGRKPIWFVYEAMGTPRESAVLDPYREVIGLRAWSELAPTPAEP